MDAEGTIHEGDTLVLRSFDDKSSYILQVNAGEKKINRTRVSLKGIVGQPYGAVFELSNRKFFRISESEEWETELFAARDGTGGADPEGAEGGEGAGEGVEGVEGDVASSSKPGSAAAVVAVAGAVVAGTGAVAAGSAEAAAAEAGAAGAAGAGVVAVVEGVVKGDNSHYVDTNTAQRLSNEDIVKLKDSGSTAQQIIQTLIQHSDTFASKTDFAQVGIVYSL
jgi:hypothetical protein